MPRSLKVALPNRIAIAAILEIVLALVIGVPEGLPILWVGLVTGIVGIAVRVGYTPLLGKSAEGALPIWWMAIFWPWHLMTRSVAWSHRYTHPPVVTEVHPGWYIGGWPMPGDVPPGTAILDMTCELPRRVEGPYLCVPTWDGMAPTLADLERATAWARQQRAEGRAVLVHCAHGRGRSAMTLVAALVVADVHPDWETAWEHVASRRFVRMSGFQKRRIAEWAGLRKPASQASGVEK